MQPKFPKVLNKKMAWNKKGNFISHQKSTLQVHFMLLDITMKPIQCNETQFYDMYTKILVGSI